MAAGAGVSPQTVYNSVGGKAALLKAVYDRAVAGDDEPVAIAEREQVAAMRAMEDPRALLAAYADLGEQIAEHLAAAGWLRPGVDVDEAADVLWSVTAPEVAVRLAVQRGWGWPRYGRWLGATLVAALLP